MAREIAFYYSVNIEAKEWASGLDEDIEMNWESFRTVKDREMHDY